MLGFIYMVLSKDAKQNRQYDTAFYYQEKYTDVIEDITYEHLQQSVYDIQQKYDYQKKENLYNRKLLTKRNWIITLVVFALFITIFVIILIYRNLQKKKYEAEINKKLLMLQSETDEERIRYSKKESELQRQIIDELTLKFLTMFHLEIEYDKNKNSALKKLQFSDNDHWEVMLSVFEKLHPGKKDIIKEQFHNLTEQEFKICILSHFNLSRQEEADFLHCSIYSIDKYRANLQKKMSKTEKNNK